MFTVAASVGEPKESPLARARGHASPPVDTARPAALFGVVDKKPHKVEEPHATDAAIPTRHPASEFKPRYVDEATAGKTIEKLFRVHGDLLRRLAEYDRNG